MTPLPISEWKAALDAMDAALDAATAELNRYEVRHAAALAETATAEEVTPARELLAGLDPRFAALDEKLVAAAELAAAVEADLNRREATVVEWRGVFDRWRKLLEQP